MIPVVHRLVERRFAITFVDVDGGRFLTRYDRASGQELSRLEVRDSTTAASLLKRLRALVPVAPQVTGFRPAQRWSYVGGAADVAHRSGGGGVFRLRTLVRHWSAAYLMPARSELWSDYSAGVTLGDLGSAAAGASATLLFGGGRGGRYAVTVSSARLALAVVPSDAPPRRLMDVRIRSRRSHRVTVVLSGRHLAMWLDGRRIASRALPAAPHGGIGLGAWRQFASSPQPSFEGLAVRPIDAIVPTRHVATRCSTPQAQRPKSTTGGATASGPGSCRCCRSFRSAPTRSSRHSAR
jgi:hypothetical protein